jgi:hypothetical protein
MISQLKKIEIPVDNYTEINYTEIPFNNSFSWDDIAIIGSAWQYQISQLRISIPVENNYKNIDPFKCNKGMKCKKQSCKDLHPGQKGYECADFHFFFESCPYETDKTSCRLKCGSSDKRYCAYSHCVHVWDKEQPTICESTDCQFHCSKCK